MRAMKNAHVNAVIWAGMSLAAGASGAGPTLTPAEAAAGWKALFDGTSTAGWRGYKEVAFPTKGWAVEDGALHVVKGCGGGDIVTTGTYGDFELVFEFKCAAGANSGVMYRVAAGKDYPWQTGPEFQVLDDARHADGKDPKHRAGALYDLIAPPANEAGGGLLAPAEQWNAARIRLSDGLLTHWVNGVKTAECRTDGAAWKEMIGTSKFKVMAGFGMEASGHIALQDHGDDVWFRNIKVRDLRAPMPGEIALFNGKDLSGWTWFCGRDCKAKVEDVFVVQRGVVADGGTPSGYIATTAEHTSFVLRLSWRWNAPEAGKPGNSGVLVRVQRPDTVWPKSIEAQLMAGNAGDFYSIGEFPMKGAPARSKGRHVAHTRGNERPPGEWNEYEIIVDGPTIVLNVNGEELNRATECEVIPGRIALQSEGAPIFFRDARLAPIAAAPEEPK